MYCLWITPVSTPSIFSLSYTCEHLRNQLVEGNKVAVSVFNETGGEGENAVGAGTYLAVFKWIDLVKYRCVPVNFSTPEKKAIDQYILQQQ